MRIMDVITQQLQHFDSLRSRCKFKPSFLKKPHFLKSSQRRWNISSVGNDSNSITTQYDKKYGGELSNGKPAPEPMTSEPLDLQHQRPVDNHISKPPHSAVSMDLDALVVGAGWGGISSVHALRQAGFANIKLVDANTEPGGVWTYTVYPGCRNDVPVPMYQFTSEETWRDWTWEHRYPYQHEMTAYLRHACKKLDIYRDFIPSTRVSGAHWNEHTRRWTVYVKDKPFATAKYLFAATGDVTKKHIPDNSALPGLTNFENRFHTSEWPRHLSIEDLSSKRVGIIGTGASGMQIIETLGPRVHELIVFQRTPNLAIPRRREEKPFTKAVQDEEKQKYADLFEYCDTTATGLDTDWGEFPLDDPKAAEEYLEAKWDRGDFWFGNHVKMLENTQVNDIAYHFWRKKVSARIRDPQMRDILAPETPIHAFGTKRPSHESNYFEIFNQPNVSLVDLRKTPISYVSKGGIQTVDGEFYGLDVLVLATGFDYNIGSMLAIDVRGRNGTTLNQKWASFSRTPPSTASKREYHNADGVDMNGHAIYTNGLSSDGHDDQPPITGINGNLDYSNANGGTHQGCSAIQTNGIQEDSDLKDDAGIFTHLGLTTHGFPNFFFPDGPQAPSAFGVTPRLTEHQGTFLAALLKRVRTSGVEMVEPKAIAEINWRRIIEENTPELLKTADSWYMGVNIPGRIRQPLCFYGGCQSYRQYLEDEVKEGFPNFEFS